MNAPVCIASHGTVSSSGRYFQNFCNATDLGISVHGPSSGTFDIERNLIRVTGTDGIGILIESGNATISRNVITADIPIDDTNAGTVTLATNVCDDLSECPLPTDEPFTFNLDFD